MADQITQPRERQITLGGKPYTIRELTLRNIPKMSDIYQRINSPRDIPRAKARWWFQRAWLWLTGRTASTLGSLPVDITAALQLAGADITLDDVLNAYPDEATQILGIIMAMNDLSAKIQKKVMAPPETGQGK